MAAAPELIAGELDTAFLRQQVMLQRLAAGERERLVPFLKEMDTLIRQRLATEDLTTWSRKRLEKLLASIDEALKEILGEFRTGLLFEANELAKSEARFAANALRIVADLESAVPSVAQIREAVFNNPLSTRGSPLLRAFIDDWTRAERKAVAGAIRRGVFQGQTNAEIVRSIRGTRARQYQDGLLDITARNANTVVHTAMQHVSSQARQATFDENKDLIKRVRWLSTLDKKTCQQCRSLDRRVFAIDKGPRSPIHPYCRCTAIPVLADRFAFLQEGGTRASAGATGGRQVDADLSYYQWLKLQPREFVEAAIGVKRARLFLGGGISAERFAALQLDRNFEPLTLVEMQKLEPLAFLRAGVAP